MAIKLKVKEKVNIYMDKDVADFLRENFKGNMARIVNNLSREFMNETKRNEHIITDALYGKFVICGESKTGDKNN